jgi:hypothetical protein
VETVTRQRRRVGILTAGLFSSLQGTVEIGQRKAAGDALHEGVGFASGQLVGEGHDLLARRQTPECGRDVFR